MIFQFKQTICINVNLIINIKRCDIFKCYLERTKHSLSQDDILEINLQMNGFTGADVVSLLRETLLERVKE